MTEANILWQQFFMTDRARIFLGMGLAGYLIQIVFYLVLFRRRQIANRWYQLAALVMMLGAVGLGAMQVPDVAVNWFIGTVSIYSLSPIGLSVLSVLAIIIPITALVFVVLGTAYIVRFWLKNLAMMIFLLSLSVWLSGCTTSVIHERSEYCETHGIDSFRLFSGDNRGYYSPAIGLSINSAKNQATVDAAPQLEPLKVVAEFIHLDADGSKKVIYQRDNITATIKSRGIIMAILPDMSPELLALPEEPEGADSGKGYYLSEVILESLRVLSIGNVAYGGNSSVIATPVNRIDRPHFSMNSAYNQLMTDLPAMAEKTVSGVNDFTYTKLRDWSQSDADRPRVIVILRLQRPNDPAKHSVYQRQDFDLSAGKIPVLILDIGQDGDSQTLGQLTIVPLGKVPHGLTIPGWPLDGSQWKQQSDNLRTRLYGTKQAGMMENDNASQSIQQVIRKVSTEIEIGPAYWPIWTDSTPNDRPSQIRFAVAGMKCILPVTFTNGAHSGIFKYVNWQIFWVLGPISLLLIIAGHRTPFIKCIRSIVDRLMQKKGG